MTMKKLLFLLLTLILFGCEMYDEPSYPGIYMGGGKWTLTDYYVVIVSAVSPITILKSDIVENDTVCVNSFGELVETSTGVIMKQDYKSTSLSRRFIKGKTQWEFDGPQLYCEWMNTNGGMIPAHVPFGVNYISGNTRMQIEDSPTASIYTFTTRPDFGVTPRSVLIMESTNIVASYYSSGRSYDKAVTFRVVLTFMR
jgi:hypothetical protein